MKRPSFRTGFWGIYLLGYLIVAAALLEVWWRYF